MIKVAVDAMGGDLAPVEMVAGAVEAVNAKPGIQAPTALQISPTGTFKLSCNIFPK